MPAISAYLEKAYLDWACGGAAVVTPTYRYAGLAVGTPSSNFNAASEMLSATGYTRATVTFCTASSPAGSASNLNQFTFGPFNSAGSVLGIHVWNTATVGSSDMMWYGTLAAARTFSSGDTLIFAAGALTLTLS